MHDIEQASKEKKLREEVAAKPDAVDTYQELASLLFETGRSEESVDTLRRALSAPLGDIPRAVLLTSLGWYILAITDRIEEPRTMGELAITLTEGMETCEGLLARAKARALLADCAWGEDVDRAEELAASARSILNRVLESDSLPDGVDRYETLIVAARVNALMRQFDEASSRCQEALGTASNKNEQLEALNLLGSIHRVAGQLADAREVFQRAVRLDAAPFWLVRLYYELGVVEGAMGKLAEARAKIRRAIEILQSDPPLLPGKLPELLLFYGQLSYDLEDTDQAAKSFQAAVSSSPVDGPFHRKSLLWVARCQYDLGQLKSARVSAERVKQSPFATDEERSVAEEMMRNIDASNDRRT